MTMPMPAILAVLALLAPWPAAAGEATWREAPRRWLAAVTPEATRIPSGRIEVAAAVEAGGEALALAGARLAWGEGAPWLSGHAELAPRWPALADLAFLRWRLDARAALGAFEVAQENDGRLWDALPGGALLAELARAARR
jgi:hypothetical protein